MRTHFSSHFFYENKIRKYLDKIGRIRYNNREAHHNSFKDIHEKDAFYTCDN